MSADELAKIRNILTAGLADLGVSTNGDLDTPALARRLVHAATTNTEPGEPPSEGHIRRVATLAVFEVLDGLTAEARVRLAKLHNAAEDAYLNGRDPEEGR